MMSGNEREGRREKERGGRGKENDRKGERERGSSDKKGRCLVCTFILKITTQNKLNQYLDKSHLR